SWRTTSRSWMIVWRKARSPSPPCKNSRRSRALISSTTSPGRRKRKSGTGRSEEHTSELQSLTNLVCRLLLEKKKTNKDQCAEEKTRHITHTMCEHEITSTH